MPGERADRDRRDRAAGRSWCRSAGCVLAVSSAIMREAVRRWRSCPGPSPCRAWCSASGARRRGSLRAAASADVLGGDVVLEVDERLASRAATRQSGAIRRARPVGRRQVDGWRGEAAVVRGLERRRARPSRSASASANCRRRHRRPPCPAAACPARRRRCRRPRRAAPRWRGQVDVGSPAAGDGEESAGDASRSGRRASGPRRLQPRPPMARTTAPPAG